MWVALPVAIASLGAWAQAPASSLDTAKRLEDLDPNDNIHASERCDLCHEAALAGERSGPLRIPASELGRMCSCHFEGAPSEGHPTDVVPSAELAPNIPDSLPLTDGKVTCSTCHDAARLFGRGWRSSLRGDAKTGRSGLCFECHDVARYVKENPHDQLDSEGRVVTQKCVYCHGEVPDDWMDDMESVSFVLHVRALCERCHPQPKEHPSGDDHMVVPSLAAQKRMAALVEREGIILPLDPEGRLTCVTCHNPHERGVLPERRPAARGADAAARHRLPGTLCMECHQK